MKVLVIGRQGQVARSLEQCGQARPHQLIALGRPDLDMTDAASVEQALEDIAPDIVVNAAAYTAVDKAESDEANAFQVNSHAVARLAEQTADRDIPIVHFSTDYVFDGENRAPYIETDAVAPIGVYGHSKLAGEAHIRANNPKHLILRTAWVYSPFGNNFVRTMLRLAEDRDELGVVSDQVGSPSYAVHLAEGLLDMLDKLENSQITAWGTYHMAGTGEASWADMAERVFADSASQGGPTAQVKRIKTTEFPTPAKRPANSRLNTDNLYEDWNVRLPDWQAGVQDCVARLMVRSKTDAKGVT